MARDIFSLVGRIRTDGFDTLKSNLNTVNKRVIRTANTINKFGRNVQKLGVGLTKLTAPITAIGAGLAVLTVKTGQYADSMLDLAEVTGLSTDSLQEFELVSKDAGVSFEGLMGTISKFQSRLPMIAKGTGPAADAMELLGTNVFDASGNVKDMDSLFPELIKKLQGVKNISERNALAQQIFGRSMQDLAPILGMSGDQLDKVRQSAHDMGVVMSRESLEKANQFRKTMETLQLKLAAAGRELAVGFLPIFQNVLIPFLQNVAIPAMQKFGNIIQSMGIWFSELTPFMQDTAIALITFVAGIGPLLIGVGKLISVVKTLKTTWLTLNAVMLANPILLVIALIAGLVTAGVVLYRNWDTVKEKLASAWDTIKYAFEQGVSFLKTALFTAVQAYLKYINLVARFIPGLSDKVDGLITKLDELKASEKELRFERSETRKAIKAEKEETEKLNKIIAKGTKAINKHNEAKENQRRKTLAQLEAEKKAAAEKEKLDKKAADEKEKLIEKEKLAEEEKRQQIKDTGIRLVNQAFDVFAKATDNKIKKAEFAADKEIKILTERYDAEILKLDQLNLSDSERAAKRELLDKKYADSKREIELSLDEQTKELRLKQARRDKAAAIFGIAVDTARGIAAALTIPPPLGWIMAGTTAGLGAIQAGLVAATPLPELAEGATITSSPGGANVIVGEGKQDELILPMRTGLNELVNGVVSGVKNLFTTPVLPSSLAGAQAAPVGGVFQGPGPGTTVLQVGTIIATDSSYRELWRKLKPFGIKEGNRTGQHGLI